MKKDTVFHIRITKAFKDTLKKNADKQNEPMSVYVIKSINERIKREDRR